eukprot:13391623-Ditylum_brightwellii.AAC.1
MESLSSLVVLNILTKKPTRMLMDIGFVASHGLQKIFISDVHGLAKVGDPGFNLICCELVRSAIFGLGGGRAQ